jgi:maltooligosyltrehalose synthase
MRRKAKRHRKLRIEWKRAKKDYEKGEKTFVDDIEIATIRQKLLSKFERKKRQRKKKWTIENFIRAKGIMGTPF